MDAANRNQLKFFSQLEDSQMNAHLLHNKHLKDPPFLTFPFSFLSFSHTPSIINTQHSHTTSNLNNTFDPHTHHNTLTQWIPQSRTRSTALPPSRSEACVSRHPTTLCPLFASKSIFSCFVCLHCEAIHVQRTSNTHWHSLLFKACLLTSWSIYHLSLQGI